MARAALLLAAPLALLGLAAALAGPPPKGTGPEALAAAREAFRRPDAVPFPAGNPWSQAKEELGRRLFFDRRLSGTGTQSCADCHDPAKGFEDGRASAVGARGREVGHHTPTLWNLAWAERLFRDGRAANLEEQVLGPLASPDEMDRDLATLPGDLAADTELAPLFRLAFPDAPEPSVATIAEALATFERTLVSPPTSFDRWVEGEEDAIPKAARRGFALFTGKAGCARCHSGWNFTDEGFHDIGLPGTVPGRGGFMGEPRLANAVKTPGLRDIGRRAPYMHDGSLATLADVVRHYAEGIVERPSLSQDLPRIELDEAERADLLAFLATLDAEPGAVPAAAVAASAPPPELPAEPPAEPPAGLERSEAPALVEVVQKDKSFSAGHVRLRHAGRLLVHNHDTREHNIRVFAPGLDYDSGFQQPGETIELRFPSAGTYHAYCAIHPKMKLKVEVAP
jgi:cytochrome c peroxidase